MILGELSVGDVWEPLVQDPQNKNLLRVDTRVVSSAAASKLRHARSVQKNRVWQHPEYEHLRLSIAEEVSAYELDDDAAGLGLHREKHRPWELTLHRSGSMLPSGDEDSAQWLMIESDVRQALFEVMFVSMVTHQELITVRQL
jgi:hypothetical protein